MKTTFFSRLFVSLFFAIFFMNCTENEAHQFSHNEDINQWVNENKTQLLNFERKEIKELDFEKQKAVMRLLPPEKRRKVWAQKINYILQMNLSEAELNHMKYFAEEFKKIDYKAPISDEFSDELYEKVMIGAKKFNWNEEFIYTAFFTVGDVSYSKLNEDLNSNNLTTEGIDPPCVCRYSASCFGYNNTCHKPDKCTVANTDCGVFGTSTCNGYCTDDIFIPN